MVIGLNVFFENLMYIDVAKEIEKLKSSWHEKGKEIENELRDMIYISILCFKGFCDEERGRGCIDAYIMVLSRDLSDVNIVNIVKCSRHVLASYYIVYSLIAV